MATTTSDRTVVTPSTPIDHYFARLGRFSAHPLLPLTSAPTNRTDKGITVNSIDTIVALAPDEAEAAVRAALAEEGFGVLTEIDVAAVFKAKLGVDRPFLKILGACNPGYALRALELDASVSLLLPCNVTVEATESGTRVAAVDPLELMNDPAFQELAAEVSVKLRRAIDQIRRA